MTEHSRAGRALALGILLGANSFYLAVSDDPTPFYFANVVAHPVLGIALAALAVGARREGWTPGRAGYGTLLAGAAALASGLVLLATGTTRPWLWLLNAHLVLAGLAAVFALAWLSRVAGPLRAGLALSAALLGVLSPAARWVRDANPPLDEIRNPELPPLTMQDEGAGAGSPFFPSSAKTDVGTTIPSNFFMTSADCGRCHPDIYAQWQSSMHRFSSFNNQWYRKAIEYMQDVVGTEPSKWCAGCHDHAVFFNGRFDRPMIEQIDTPEAQNGLGCTSCHSIVHVDSTMGNGGFTIEYPPLHDLAVSENPVIRLAHDYLLELDPGPHKRTFLKSFHTDQTAEFCSACHKVHLDVPVNDYRWFRGFNEYDNWQASGVSGQGARSFYYPPEPKDCGDCHMPEVPSDDPAAENGMIHDHRFPGANTAVPHATGHDEQLKLSQSFLQAGQVSIDVFGVVRTEAPENLAERRVAGAEPRIASTFAVGEESLAMGAGAAVLTPPAEVLAPIDQIDLALHRGESVRLEVVLRTRGVGHFFPGGTVDAFDVWVELEAVDSNGKSLLHSGWLHDGDGPVDPSAHFYRSLMLDERGNPIDKRNAFAARSVAYVHLIPPGAADTIHYRLEIPEDCGDEVKVTARVNYRKFAWWNTQWAYAGDRDPGHKQFSLGSGHDDGNWVFTGDTSDVSGEIKRIPDIPITVMAAAEASFRVVDAGAEVSEPAPYLDASVRERWNDYGIGLLLQGDLKGAEATFLKVTEMEPGYADGWVNVGRARVQVGDARGAEQILRRALEVDPDLAKTHFFLAMALKAQGRYDEAFEHLRAAAAQYPRDRVVRNQIGRMLFLKRQFADAVAEFRKVLAIDPEDLSAHYNLMLSYQGLGRQDMKETHEALYRRFKADESSQFITGPYRQLHPFDNNERQAVHEHRQNDEPPDYAPAPKRGGSSAVAGGGR